MTPKRKRTNPEKIRSTIFESFHRETSFKDSKGKSTESSIQATPYLSIIIVREESKTIELDHAKQNKNKNKVLGCKKPTLQPRGPETDSSFESSDEDMKPQEEEYHFGCRHSVLTQTKEVDISKQKQRNGWNQDTEKDPVSFEEYRLLRTGKGETGGHVTVP